MTTENTRVSASSVMSRVAEIQPTANNWRRLEEIPGGVMIRASVPSGDDTHRGDGVQVGTGRDDSRLDARAPPGDGDRGSATPRCDVLPLFNDGLPDRVIAVSSAPRALLPLVGRSGPRLRPLLRDLCWHGTVGNHDRGHPHDRQPHPTREGLGPDGVDAERAHARL